MSSGQVLSGAVEGQAMAALGVPPVPERLLLAIDGAVRTMETARRLMHRLGQPMRRATTVEHAELHAFPALPFAHTILGGKPAAKAAHSSWELPEPLSKAIESAYNGEMTFSARNDSLFFRPSPAPAREVPPLQCPSPCADDEIFDSRL